MADEILRTTASFTTPLGKKLAKASNDLVIKDTSTQPAIYAYFHDPVKSFSKVMTGRLTSDVIRYEYPTLNFGDGVFLSVEIRYDSQEFYDEYLATETHPEIWMEGLGEQGGSSLSKADFKANVSVIIANRKHDPVRKIVTYMYNLAFFEAKGIMLTKASIAFYTQLRVVPQVGEGAKQYIWKSANKLCLTNDKYWFYVPTFTFDNRYETLQNKGYLFSGRYMSGGGAAGSTSYSGGSHYPPGNTGEGLTPVLCAAINGFGDPNKAPHGYPTPVVTFTSITGGSGGTPGIWGNGSAFSNGKGGEGGKVLAPTEQDFAVVRPLGFIYTKVGIGSAGFIKNGDTAPPRPNPWTAQKDTGGDYVFTALLTASPHKRGRYMDGWGGRAANGIGDNGWAFGGEGGGGAMLQAGIKLVNPIPEVLATGLAGSLHILSGGTSTTIGGWGGAGGTIIQANNPREGGGGTGYTNYVHHDALYVPNTTGDPTKYIAEIYFRGGTWLIQADKELYPNG